MKRRDILRGVLGALGTSICSIDPSRARNVKLNENMPVDYGDFVSTRFVARMVLALKEDFSYKRNFLGVPNLPGSNAIRKRLQALYAIYLFAPELRIHPDENYHPTSVKLFLPKVRLRRHRSWDSDVQYLDTGDVTLDALISISDAHQHSGKGTAKSDFFLEIYSREDSTRAGSLANAICYVHFRKAPTGVDWDIQYWFFYAYNGDITTGFDFEHEGDWEHVTARISSDFKSIKKVFYASHNTESEWRKLGDFSLTEGNHPIAYAAYHSHANFWNAGEQERAWYLPNDETANGGPIWKTWNSLQLIGDRTHPLPNQQWIKYTGHWGQIGTGFSWLGGPYGPAFQEWWKDDDSGS